MNIELTQNMQARLSPEEGTFGVSIQMGDGGQLGLFAYNVCEWEKAVKMAKQILVMDMGRTIKGQNDEEAKR